MIIMLGQGILYQIHRNRQQWLTELERRKAFRFVVAIAICVTLSVMLWITH